MGGQPSADILLPIELLTNNLIIKNEHLAYINETLQMQEILKTFLAPKNTLEIQIFQILPFDMTILEDNLENLLINQS